MPSDDNPRDHPSSTVGRADLDRLLAQGMAQHQAGDLANALVAYRRVLQADPAHTEALHLAGVLAHQSDRDDEAEGLIRQAIEQNPADPRYHNNLGEVYRALGRFPIAEDCYNCALGLEPNYPDALYNLGTAKLQQGQFLPAIKAFEGVVALDPGHVDALVNMGLALVEVGRVQQAVDAYQRALRIAPRHTGALNNLGVALLRSDPDQAKRCFTQVLAVDPGRVEAHNNLAKVLLELGFVTEAIAGFKRAIDLAPDFVEAHSNLLLAMHYDPVYDRVSFYRAHLAWSKEHADPITPISAVGGGGDRDRDPNRRLRVGYVSPNFRTHAVAAFFEPLIARHDHARFEIICYSDVTCPDPTTERIKGHADRWVNLVGMSDDDAAAIICRDRVDVLVDLSGHIADNRLLVFARCPAPVQVTYIGYPDTTGLAAMDYRLTDAYLDPPGLADRNHTETLVRLDGSFCCYQPPSQAPAVSTLPAERNGHVTFACFNGAYKVNDAVIDTWSRILHALPEARLLIRIGGGRDQAAPFRDRLIANRIHPDRVSLVPKKNIEGYLRLYHDVDIALDPFPYNGHTTTCDALWMGVPVVTLIGDTHVSRTGYGLLKHLGIDELARESVEDYVRVAVELAGDTQRLGRLRSGLRSRMVGSVLTDAGRLSRNIEVAYREMWRKYCKNKSI